MIRRAVALALAVVGLLTLAGAVQTMATQGRFSTFSKDDDSFQL